MVSSGFFFVRDSRKCRLWVVLLACGRSYELSAFSSWACVFKRSSGYAVFGWKLPLESLLEVGFFDWFWERVWRCSKTAFRSSSCWLFLCGLACCFWDGRQIPGNFSFQFLVCLCYVLMGLAIIVRGQWSRNITQVFSDCCSLGFHFFVLFCGFVATPTPTPTTTTTTAAAATTTRSASPSCSLNPPMLNMARKPMRPFSGNGARRREEYCSSLSNMAKWL